MQGQLTDTYTELMQNLAELPERIHEVQTTITEAKLDKANSEKMLADVELATIEKAGGWKSLGANEGDRKNNLQIRLNEDSAYLRHQRSLEDTEHQLAILGDDLTHLERMYGAVCYQTRLHAALLTYLGSAGAPVEHAEINFRTNNNHVTTADAAAIGL